MWTLIQLAFHMNSQKCTFNIYPKKEALILYQQACIHNRHPSRFTIKYNYCITSDSDQLEYTEDILVLISRLL